MKIFEWEELLIRQVTQQGVSQGRKPERVNTEWERRSADTYLFYPFRRQINIGAVLFYSRQ